jgi:hypothetical protein
MNGAAASVAQSESVVQVAGKQGPAQFTWPGAKQVSSGGQSELVRHPPAAASCPPSGAAAPSGAVPPSRAPPAPPAPPWPALEVIHPVPVVPALPGPPVYPLPQQATTSNGSSPTSPIPITRLRP